VITWANSIRKS